MSETPNEDPNTDDLAPEGGTPEGGAPEGGEPEAPDYEKLKADHEALLAEHEQTKESYAALRKKMSQEGAPKPPADEDEPKPDEPKPDEPKPDDAPEDDPEEVVLDEEQSGRMMDEIKSNGALSPQSIAELEALGFERQYIQQQVGAIAAQAMRENAIYGQFGDTPEAGEAMFMAAAKWASSGKLQEDEITALQTRLDSEDVEVAKAAARELVDRARADRPPNLVEGQAFSGAAPGDILTQEDLSRAVMDPRYKRDAQYTEQVHKKMRALQR